MSSLGQNISRYKDFDESLRALITDEGGTIPANTACEGLIPIIRDLIEDESSSKIYGVSGLSDSNVELTRTDDAVDLDYEINSSTGAIDSDFDGVFPWTKTGIVNLEQGKFLRMPEMFFRIGADSSGRLTDVAVSSQPHNQGNWFRVPEFYYACYGASASGNALVSSSGAERLTNKTRSEFRAYASNCGTGYSQLDLYHRTVMMFLWYIEFATKKSDSIMTGRISGSGTQGGTSKRPTGGTNSVETPSGYETEYGQMRYHYIEDFVGNLWEYVDGVYCSPIGSADYVTANPSSFSDDTTGKSLLGYSSPADGCISALGWDSDNPFLCMPYSVVDNGYYNTYFCDRSYNNSSVHPSLYCGSHYDSSSVSFGLSFFNRNMAATAKETIGGRLIYV